MTFEQILLIAAPVLSGASAYWGGMLSVRVEMARHDEQIRALKERVDSDHARLDDLHNAVVNMNRNGGSNRL